jgi:hypothetical protein
MLASRESNISVTLSRFTITGMPILLLISLGRVHFKYLGCLPRSK